MSFHETVSKDSMSPHKRPRLGKSLPRQTQDLNAELFFQSFVSPRQPCLWSSSNLANKLSLDQLQDLLGDCIVQVEQRADDQQAFGQGRTAEFLRRMSFKDFVKQSKAARQQFYLSTQTTANDKYPQYSCLTQRLVQAGHIPAQAPMCGNLQLDSCHLWMGAAQQSCSGLHHDFHDNFYCLVSGRKVLYLYPPQTKIPVHGTIQTIHDNGLISYASQPTRADGVPLALLLESQVAKGKQDEECDDDGDDDEDEEVVIGKGFYYQSDDDDDDDDDDGENFEIDSTRDDFDALEGDDNRDDSKTEQDPKPPSSSKPLDHFSPVNLDSPTILDDYPVMRECEPMVVELKAGDIMYLPASWFHCVWSYADTDDFHIAINYWYHVPDQLDSFEKPYKDDYWIKQATKES